MWKIQQRRGSYGKIYENMSVLLIFNIILINSFDYNEEVLMIVCVWDNFDSKFWITIDDYLYFGPIYLMKYLS
jgi:hypothetical protein